MAAVEYAEFYPPLGMFGGPGQPWPLSYGVDPLDLGAHKGKDLMVVAEPIDPTLGLALGPYGPMGATPSYPGSAADGWGDWGWKGLPVTLYVANQWPRPPSANDDTPPAQYVPARLLPFNFGAALFDGVDPLSRNQPGEGILEFADPDDQLEYLLGYVWDAAAIRLMRGTPGSRFDTWSTVGKFRAAGLLYDLDGKQIHLRNLGWQLSGPLHGEFYAGTGGVEGDDSRKGTFKPWALGYCFNVEPVLLSATDQIFQWSLGASQACSALRHGGVPIDFHADYPTYEALRDAAIPSGRYGTCLAKSLARPNLALQYGIRVDVIGDADVAWGHPGPTRRAGIARRIATTRGPNRLDDVEEIDMFAFSAFDQRHTAPVGWHFGEQISKAEALDRVLAGVLGWWRVGPDGQLKIGYVGNPAAGGPLAFAYKADGMGLPRKTAWGPPRAGTFVSWRWNYGREQRSALALGVAEADAALFTQPARYASAQSPAVTAHYPTARVVKLDEAGFWNEADAVLECNRQQGILEVERQGWEWDLAIDPFADIVGLQGAIHGVNRLGLGAAKPFLLNGLDTGGGPQSRLQFFI
jgi:hypothetical protein